MGKNKLPLKQWSKCKTLGDLHSRVLCVFGLFFMLCFLVENIELEEMLKNIVMSTVKLKPISANSRSVILYLPEHRIGSKKLFLRRGREGRTQIRAANMEATVLISLAEPFLLAYCYMQSIRLLYFLLH